MGCPVETCARAVRMLMACDHTTVRAVSSLYLTEPVAEHEQPWFYNFALKAVTTLDPGQLLEFCQSIETALGRVRTVSNGPRIIDLDLLYFGQKIINEGNLIIPHPRLTERKFVLVPLVEIAPDFLDPVQRKSMLKLLRQVNDKHAILLYEKNWLEPLQPVGPDRGDTAQSDGERGDEV